MNIPLQQQHSYAMTKETMSSDWALEALADRVSARREVGKSCLLPAFVPSLLTYTLHSELRRVEQ
jgi:hypothetical protein